jgi:hypothetical protein
MTAKEIQQGTASSRVLAYVKLHPGHNAENIYAGMSGIERLTIIRTLEYLKSTGAVKAEKHGRVLLWFVDDAQKQAESDVATSPTRNIWTDYVPPKDEVVRPGALDHEGAKSRRGDVLVPHQPPITMCVGKLANTISHTAAPLGSGKRKPEPRPVARRQQKRAPQQKAATQQVKAFQRLHGPETIEQVVALRKTGLSYSAICTETGVSISQVQRWCKAAEGNPDNKRMPPRAAPPTAAINAKRTGRPSWAQKLEAAS